MREHFDAPVDLRPAFVFVCHDCGRDSYTRPEAVIFDNNAEREEAAKQLGINIDSLDNAVGGIPEYVICQHCKSRFESHLDAYNPREYDDD